MVVRRIKFGSAAEFYIRLTAIRLQLTGVSAASRRVTYGLRACVRAGLLAFSC